MNRRNIASFAVIISSIFCAPNLQAQARTATPPAAAGISLFCYAAKGGNTVYFTNVFDGGTANVSNAGRAFTQYLMEKYSYEGRAVCTGGATSEQAKTLLDQELTVLRKQGNNVIQTNWVFDASAAAAKPAVAAANARPAPAPAPVAAPAPAVTAPAAAPAQNPAAAASAAAAISRARNPVPSPPPAAAPSAPTPRPSATTPAPASNTNATISAYCISDESKSVIYVSDVFDTGMGQQTSDASAFLNLMATAYNFSDYLKNKYQYTYAKTTDEPGATCLRHGDAALVQQDRQKWQAAQQAAKKQIVAATWKFTPDSMKLASAPAPAPQTPATPLPSGPGVLAWAQITQKDQLTDEISTETMAGTTIGKASAPITFSVRTKCSRTGFRFIMTVTDAVHSTANPPFGWATNDTGDDYIPMRIRIDSGTAHQTIAFADSDGDGPTKKQYVNSPVLLFYDTRGIENDANSAIPLTGLGAFDGFIGALTRDASKATAQQMENDAAGSLAQLVNSSSIRVEIPLVDGQNPIVDLNPRDKVLQPVIQKCVSKLK